MHFLCTFHLKYAFICTFMQYAFYLQFMQLYAKVTLFWSTFGVSNFQNSHVRIVTIEGTKYALYAKSVPWL